MLDIHDQHRNFVRTPSGLILSDDAARLRYAPKRHLQAGDIFAGCGGASCGFKGAGIQVRFAVEWDILPAITYMLNLGSYPCSIHFENDERKAKMERELQRYMKPDPKTGVVKRMITSGSSGMMSRFEVPGTDHMWIWDAAKLTGAMLLEPLGMKPGDLDMLHGSPPCQGFSTAGHQNPHDPRNNLMLEYGRLICEIQPKAFSLEQVPNVINMTTADGQPMLDAFMDCIEEGGYASRKQLSKMLQMQGHDMALLRKTRKSNDPEKIKADSRASRGEPAPANPQIDMFSEEEGA